MEVMGTHAEMHLNAHVGPAAVGPVCCGQGGYGISSGIILVLFILLVIVSRAILI